MRDKRQASSRVGPRASKECDTRVNELDEVLAISSTVPSELSPYSFGDSVLPLFSAAQLEQTPIHQQTKYWVNASKFFSNMAKSNLATA